MLNAAGHKDNYSGFGRIVFAERHAHSVNSRLRQQFVGMRFFGCTRAIDF